MIINSSLCITHYAGQSFLSLSGQPTNLTIDQLSDWQKLMQNTSTIYGSQTTDGSIPTFWTKLSGISNGIKIYDIDSNSTLTGLVPKSSYYFIMRDTTNLPINIPAAGGPLDGFLEPIQNLPTIDIIPATSQTEFNDQINIYSFTINVSQLQSYKNYTYNIEVLDAEWPTYFIGKPSGTLTTGKVVLDTIREISSTSNKLVFCNTGVCDDYPEIINDYTLPSYPEFWTASVDHRIIIRASLKCNDCLNNNTVYSDYKILKYTTTNTVAPVPGVILVSDQNSPAPPTPPSQS